MRSGKPSGRDTRFTTKVCTLVVEMSAASAFPKAPPCLKSQVKPLDATVPAETKSNSPKRRMGLLERLIKIFITFVVFIIAQGFLAGSINTFFDLIPWAKVDHLFGDTEKDPSRILTGIESSDAAHRSEVASAHRSETTSAMILSSPLYT